MLSQPLYHCRANQEWYYVSWKAAFTQPGSCNPVLQLTVLGSCMSALTFCCRVRLVSKRGSAMLALSKPEKGPASYLCFKQFALLHKQSAIDTCHSSRSQRAHQSFSMLSIGTAIPGPAVASMLEGGRKVFGISPDPQSMASLSLLRFVHARFRCCKSSPASPQKMSCRPGPLESFLLV